MYKYLSVCISLNLLVQKCSMFVSNGKTDNIITMEKYFCGLLKFCNTSSRVHPISKQYLHIPHYQAFEVLWFIFETGK